MGKEDRERMQKLGEYISVLHENRDTPLMSYVLATLEELVNRARVENDEADPTYLLHNQAKIRAWKQVIEYIEKGVPK